MGSAFFLDGAEQARVGPFALRNGKPGEVKLRVAGVGICGSDLHYYKDGGIGGMEIHEPFVPGHEFAGRLAEDDPESGLREGDLVAVDPNDPCGTCDHCRAGHANLCPHVDFIGAPPHHGAMTEEVWAPRHLLVRLPEGFGPDEAVMLEPLGVAIHAVDLARPKPGERVAVLGAGPIGLLGLQVLRAVGAGDVIVVEPHPHRRSMAVDHGSTHAVANVNDLVELTGGEGTPLVVEATNSPHGFRDAVEASRIGGRLVLVGIPDGDTYTLPAADARRRGLTVRFSRRMGDVYSRAIDLVASGKVDVRSMITDRIGLDEAPATFRRLAKGDFGIVKALIYPNGR